ncbi:hypothetical protein ACLOJK_006545 [Asimina triloba]
MNANGDGNEINSHTTEVPAVIKAPDGLLNAWDDHVVGTKVPGPQLEGDIATFQEAKAKGEVFFSHDSQSYEGGISGLVAGRYDTPPNIPSHARDSQPSKIQQTCSSKHLFSSLLFWVEGI